MRIVIDVDQSTGQGFPMTTHHPSWEALQSTVLSALYDTACDPEASAHHMVRISRDDHGANYRAHGSYMAELRDGTTVRITSEG